MIYITLMQTNITCNCQNIFDSLGCELFETETNQNLTVVRGCVSNDNLRGYAGHSVAAGSLSC